MKTELRKMTIFAVTVQEIRDAFARGRRDRDRGASRSSVPYKDRDRAEAWERGFDFKISRKAR